MPLSTIKHPWSHCAPILKSISSYPYFKTQSCFLPVKQNITQLEPTSFHSWYHEISVTTPPTLWFLVFLPVLYYGRAAAVSDECATPQGTSSDCCSSPKTHQLASYTTVCFQVFPHLYPCYVSPKYQGYKPDKKHMVGFVSVSLLPDSNRWKL